MNLDVSPEIVRRLGDVRDQRRRPDGSLPVPPSRWPEVVQWTWPTLWPGPLDLPLGWCDLVVALSDHVIELDPAAEVIDAFEDHQTGLLRVRYCSKVEATAPVFHGYGLLSLLVCRECGEQPASPHSRKRVLCENHEG